MRAWIAPTACSSLLLCWRSSDGLIPSCGTRDCPCGDIRLSCFKCSCSAPVAYDVVHLLATGAVWQLGVGASLEVCGCWLLLCRANTPTNGKRQCCQQKNAARNAESCTRAPVGGKAQPLGECACGIACHVYVRTCHAYVRTWHCAIRGKRPDWSKSA